MTEGRLSILHLCAPAHVGGLERVVQALATGAHGQGHEVAVAAVVEPGSSVEALARPLEAGGVPLLVCEVPGRRYDLELRQVRRLLDARRPDVLHTHGYRSDLLHRRAGARRGVAMVSTLHGSSRMGGLSHVFEWMQLRALRKFDAVVAVSAPLVEELKGLGISDSRLHLVPNGWMAPARTLDRAGARRELGLADSGFVFGWVGRHIPIKGCDLFLAALAQVTDQSWTAVVVGDGPESPSLRQMAAELGIVDRVRFVGARPEAAELMPAFDAFVLSSRSEGTPMVILEAMGQGVPVVAAAVGGVPDVVRNDEDGWVVPPEDPMALAAGLRAALADPAGLARRGQQAQARVRAEFGTRTWVDRHMEVYHSALAHLRHDNPRVGVLS